MHFGACLLWQAEHAGITVSKIKSGSARKCSQHTHRQAFFSLLVSGHYSETYGNGVLNYRPFDLGFHPEGTEHSDRTDEAGSIFFLIELEQPWVGRLLEYSAVDDLRPRLCNPQASWLAARLYSARAGIGLSPLALEGVVLELLATLAPCRRNERNAPRWIGSVRDLLNATYACRHTLGSIARILDLHPVYLARTFRKFQGESPAEYLMGVRIRVAMNQLANSELPVSEIALLSGFFDQSHLTRALKQHTGMTPAAFRMSAASEPQEIHLA
jgi:AraC family transcriptional regulator